VIVSIIIPVKGDRRISQALDKLLALPSPMENEILVVHSSCGLLDDVRQCFPSVRWVSFQPDGPKRYTFKEQINLGLRSASGDCLACGCLAFIDADCFLLRTGLHACSSRLQTAASSMFAEPSRLPAGRHSTTARRNGRRSSVGDSEWYGH
jgi:hypothetical protein